MGKASSNKKVARAAKAGGSRARAAGERNLVFPAALAVVVVLGSLLVFYARDNRQAEALEAPLLSDHWHSAYAVYRCDGFVPDLPEFVAPQNGGTHTHGDGLIHIHPFSSSRTGDNATLDNFFADAGEVLGNEGGLGDDSFSLPGRETLEEGETECADVDGDPVLQVAIWDSAAEAAEGAEPDAIVTEDLDRVRFETNGQAFTIAFVPEGTDIPAPPSSGDVAGVSSDLGVPQESIPEDAEQPNAEETDGEPSEDADTDGEPSEDADTTDTTDTDTTPTSDAPADEDPDAPTTSADSGQ